MADSEKLENSVRRLRCERGWSQDELARRAGISRTAVSAIEMQRLVPSVAAALALAAAIGCRVEDVFGGGRPGGAAAPEWAWAGDADPCRFWQAEVRGRTLLYPAEATSFGAAGHDGVYDRGRWRHHRLYAPAQTLVLASCDPAAALLADEYARTTAYRLLVVPRSSRAALRLLGDGLVHLAGVHLAAADARRDQAAAVRAELGGGYRLLHIAGWDEGLALAPSADARTVRQAVRANLRWVGRELGSGARQCLDELLVGRTPPKREARDHRGVAEAIRCGWADVGVCHRLVAADAHLKFLSVRYESYDLAFRADDEADPRLRALLAVVQSVRYRELLSELPGYDTTRTGELAAVGA